MTTNEEQFRQLTATLSPLEIEWEEWAWGRFAGDGIQHVRRDGSVIVITNDSDPDDPDDAQSWLVGFYTADEFAAAGDRGATYVYCDRDDDVLLTIIEQGQSR